MFGSALITKASVIVPGVIVVVHPVAEVTTFEILIVVFPALVRADAGMVKVPTPEATTTPVAFCVDVLAPVNPYAIEYVPLVKAEALKVTVAVDPKQIGSATETELVPPVIFGSALITNESVTLPGVIVVVQPVAEVTTLDKLIVVVPALVRADAGMVKVPTPEVTTTPVAFCAEVLAPLKLYAIEYVPLVKDEALKVTVPAEPKQIGSATETELVPPVIFGSALITNESVTLPEAKEKEQPETGIIVLISIVVVPALVRADAGMVKVPTPEVTTTPVAFCAEVLAPLKLYAIEYVPLVKDEALKVTVPAEPKQIGSATETELVPPKFKLLDTTKASVIVPAVIVVEQDEAKFVTVLI